MAEHQDRCPEPCGKIRYSRDRAKGTARRLREDGNEDERLMMAYRAHGTWHVGHSQRQNHRIARAERTRWRNRRNQVDRYDRNG